MAETPPTIDPAKDKEDNQGISSYLQVFSTFGLTVYDIGHVDLQLTQTLDDFVSLVLQVLVITISMNNIPLESPDQCHALNIVVLKDTPYHECSLSVSVVPTWRFGGRKIIPDLNLITHSIMVFDIEELSCY